MIIKRNYIISFVILLLIGLQSCDLFNPSSIKDPNNPSVSTVKDNASSQQLQNLMIALLRRHRNSTVGIIDYVGSWGREFYVFDRSDPRTLQYFTGINKNVNIEDNPDSYGSGAVWNAPYSAIKQANLIIKSVQNTNQLNKQQEMGFLGVARTLKAFEYLIPALTQKHSKGIRLNVSNPRHPGPFVPYKKAMNAILDTLDKARKNLQNAGSKFAFQLTDGYSNFNTPSKFIELNRAIYARVANYDKKWEEALAAVEDSKPFFKLGSGKNLMNKGAYFEYGGPPDTYNPLYYPRNVVTGSIDMVANSMIKDIRPGDQRKKKFFKRNDPIKQFKITAYYQGNRFDSQTSPIPWLRNEELILIYAEAKAHLAAEGNPKGSFSDADKAINDLRATWGLKPNFHTHDLATFINELLYERQYSLWGEFGQRWIDAKRYGRLDSLPKVGGQIWHYISRPQSEIEWNKIHGNK
jgi:hypothetical protein